MEEDVNQRKLLSHPLINYAEDLKNICQPLKTLGITYFSQAHIDEQGRFSALGLEPAYIKLYLEKHYYHYDIHMAQSNMNEQYVIWDSLELKNETQALEDIFRSFNYGHTFTIMQQNGKTKDYFHFATQLGNVSINDCYLSHLELLKTFILYYKEKIAEHKELKKGLEIKFELPKQQSGFQVANTFPFDQHHFKANLEIERFYIDTERYITKRELECLYWLSMGKTLEEIAVILTITLRTVKAHIRNIKEKFDCNNQFQLGMLFNKLPSIIIPKK